MMNPYLRHYGSAFFMDLALSSALTAVPFLIYDQLGGGADFSGRLAAFQSGSYAIVCLASARIVMRSKRELLWATVGAALFAIAHPLIVGIRQPVAFTVMAVVTFCALGFYWPAMQSWLGQERDPKIRGQRVAMYNIAWCLGLALAGPLTGWLYDIDYRLPFLVVFLSGAIAAALTGSLPKEKHHVESRKLDDAESSEDARSAALSEQHLYYAWCAQMLGWVLVGVMRAVYTKRMDDLVDTQQLLVFPWSNGTSLLRSAAFYYGWLALVLYASRIVITWGMGRWTGWHFRFGGLILVQCVAAGAVFWLGFTQSLAVMILCCTIIGANGAATFFASLYYSVASPEHKHRRATIHESMTGIGACAGALLFGELAARFDPTWPFRYSPILIAVFFAAQIGLYLYGRKKYPVEQAH
jgi:MFS family permease